MPRAITLLVTGFIGGILAVVGLAAIDREVSVSLDKAATAEKEPAQPQVYGRR